MWSSGPISHGQFSGKACREQVMTRQPAAEKRFTVACPMPRLAPVKRSVRRCWLGCDVGMGVNSQKIGAGSRIEARLAPGPTECRTAELDPIMQPEWPVLPELHGQRQEAIAGPIRRPRNGADHEFRGVERNCPLEGMAALERSGLVAGPCADLSKARPGGEISIRLGIIDSYHGTTQS